MSKINRLSANEVRKRFSDFFIEKDHFAFEGSSLVPKNDPTLLLINSGMAAIKPYFTGEESPPYPRLSNTQKCIRTVDIDSIGDSSHLTFFEMLGSWSIGDYGPRQAISLAKELLVDRMGLDQKDLYVTVYGGNPELGFKFDQESQDAWLAEGFSPEQIVALGDADNFWGPAGNTGPCGPCTEVFIPLHAEAAANYRKTGIFDTQNDFMEIWNAGVFMQFNKDEEGRFSRLPFASVDTGAGLERLTMALNGYKNVYDVEPYPEMKALLPENISEQDKRIYVDHTRAVSHLIADGVHPGKNGKEYVTRNLIRRMETHAFCDGVSVPYKELLDVVARHDGLNHENLAKNQYQILAAIEQESAAFKKTLERGNKALNVLINKKDILQGAAARNVLSGRDVFNIVTSHGLPLEAVTRLASAKQFVIDKDDYEACMLEHRQLSRLKKPAGGPAV